MADMIDGGSFVVGLLSGIVLMGLVVFLIVLIEDFTR